MLAMSANGTGRAASVNPCNIRCIIRASVSAAPTMHAKDLILERFTTLSPTLQAAARFIVDHPSEVVIASMRSLAQRAVAQVGFSVTTFIVATRFIGRKADNLKTLDDLKGKTVAVTTGTNTLERVRDLNTARKLNLNILNGKDHAESMLLMTSGRAVAFFEDDILLTGMAAASATPGDFALSSDGYSVDPYALMFAKGDADFKKLADGAITALYRSGEINRIYALVPDRDPAEGHHAELRDGPGAEERDRGTERFARSGRLPLSRGMSADRLPPLPESQWTDEQRAEAEPIIRGPRGALVAPFIPLMRSPELKGHAQRMGEYLRYRSALPLPLPLSELAIPITARASDAPASSATRLP